MAEELPTVNAGLFPDGLFGIKGWRRNQGILERYSEELLGDVEVAAQLDTLGKLGSIEQLIEQGRRANTRAEQRPYLSALAEVADAVGIFEHERTRAGMLDERITTSIADAARFVDVTDREQLAQLADGMLRAQERAQFDPASAMEEMRGIETELRAITERAGERLQGQFIEPLRAHEFNISSTMQQLIDAGGEDLQRNMDPDLVTQVLELAGANLGMSKEGKFSFQFQGLGWTPDQVPNMTYAEGINRLESALKGAQGYVNNQLAQRGAPLVMEVQQRLLPTPEDQDEAAAAARTERLEEATARVDEVLTPEALAPYSSEGGQNAITAALARYPEGTTIDPDNPTRFRLPDGSSVNMPASAAALVAQARRRRDRAASQAAELEARGPRSGIIVRPTNE